MTDPVKVYREPGRVITKFRDAAMREEFQKWVDDIQPTLKMHNIQPSDPIHVALPEFSFFSDTSLAKRLNRLNVTEKQQLNIDDPHLLEEVDDLVCSRWRRPWYAVDASVALTYDQRRSIEQNFHVYAQTHYPDESLMSFLPLSIDMDQPIAEMFEAHTARVAELKPLRDYFIVATDNTNVLDHTVTFMDGTAKTIDTDMLFSDDDATEHTLATLMESELPLYFVEYLN